jgi:hypothetical protein
MIDRSSRFGLMLEPVDCRSVAGYVFGKKLQSNLALQLQILGTVHHAHAATASFSMAR